MALTEEQITRLSLVKHLVRSAEAQTQAQEPLSALAVLAMHDAVEMFLDVASEVHSVPVKKSQQLMEYWGAFKAAPCQIELPIRHSIEKLNSARVALKHHGVRTSSNQVSAFMHYTIIFLQEACEICLGMPFGEISLVGLIKNSDVREHLDFAVSAASADDIKTSLTECAIAFGLGVRLLGGIDFGRLKSGVSLARSNPNLRGPQASTIVDLAESIRSIASAHGDALLMLSVGLDLRKLKRFKRMTPNIQFSMGGNWFVDTYWDETHFGKEDAQWGIDFVTDFALRVEADALP